ncbi:MAG: TIGR03643 family protein [Sphingomonadales bacterium]|nr:TIGR03643 family protein [Sphingomonadales bacterium]NCQ20695.1 TIGR03643 family protein [Sphingomonadales bacterium]NCT03693.1 TIGR03643 family protein [Sphingomonadales bacterium]
MAKHDLDPASLSEIVEMALSDSASFACIEALHGLSADEVRAVMRQTLKPGSYRAWRKRVRTFSDRRETYK